jgi:hypothetical protein
MCGRQLQRKANPSWRKIPITLTTGGSECKRLFSSVIALPRSA